MKNIFITTLILAANGLNTALSPITYTLNESDFNGIYFVDNDQDDIYTQQNFRYYDNDGNFFLNAKQTTCFEYVTNQGNYFSTGGFHQATIYELNLANYNYYLGSLNTTYKVIKTQNGDSYTLNLKCGFLYDDQTIENIYNQAWIRYNDFETINQALNNNAYLVKTAYYMTNGTSNIQTNLNYTNATQIERKLNQYKYYIESWTIEYDEPFANIKGNSQNQLISQTITQQWAGANEKIAGSSGTEIINLPDVLFKIAMIPWQFISIAFNLTIFPGTPYAINFSNLVTGLLSAILAILVVKIVFKVIK